MSQKSLLLTPGPLSTSKNVKDSMLNDWGSRDPAFTALTKNIRNNLLKISKAPESYSCVPFQGSGTYGIEAAFSTFTSPSSKVLVLTNGAYGKRACTILSLLRRPYIELEFKENEPVDPIIVENFISKNSDLSHVFMVHCETTTGVLNPLTSISSLVKSANLIFIVDAMSSFGGIPIDFSYTNIDVLISSSNKCLEGVPGIFFVLAQKTLIKNSIGNSQSLSLDISSEWSEFETSGQWRFTPPTHVVAALNEALDELEKEGGVAGRFARYQDNCNILVNGMRKLGFRTLLHDNIQAPIIVTFHDDFKPDYSFKNFYSDLQKHGFTIYPGKLTNNMSFRVGCIGNVQRKDMHMFVSTVKKITK